MAKKSLNQTEVTRKFAEVCGYSYKDADTIYKDIIKFLYYAFENDMAITLRTIGTLSVYMRKPAVHHNVTTGKQYLTDSYPNLRFKTSAKFRETMQEVWRNGFLEQSKRSEEGSDDTEE